MDVVASVTGNILTKLVDEAILQACYPFRFNSYVKELETEKENLKSKIQEVLDRAKDAKKKTHKVVGKAEKWLDEADSLMAKVVELQEKTKKRNKVSCFKHCPNLISRYNLTKQLEEKTNQIKKHSQVEFPEISRLATLVGMDYYSSNEFVPFDSRKGVYEDLLRAVEDDKINMIGLYGMGGSGKTTLVKRVGREAENFFGKVVFVSVSKTFDIRKIQSNIASQLSFEFEEEETPARARRLFMRLSSGERVLIILDDVWEKLDCEGIGIPTANNQMGCTALVTTRNSDVCELMECQKAIHLECLQGNDSWALFKKHAELFDDCSDELRDIGQKITKECGGLPVAIAAVASALRKDKSYDKWVAALKTLTNSRWIEIEEGLKSTYRCLRLSYDNLENEVAKSLFLFCSLYPEDYEIHIDDLTIIGLGLGLAGDILSYQWAAIEIIDKAINKLIDSCLLLKDPKDDSHVKMHDLVRDVALWIAEKKNKLIVGQLKEDLTMKDHAARYLWFESVDKCPNKLYCPELEFLYVSMYSESSVSIPNDFFNDIEKLRVLILTNGASFGIDLPVLQLPVSIPMINNLCCLMLYGWQLVDISFIEGLKRLESLQLWNCSFDELPQCVIRLNELRLLDLRNCTIQRNPIEVMARCSQLEVLYFCGNKGRDWTDQNKNSADFFYKISTTTPALKSYCIHFGSSDEDYFKHKSLWHRNSFVTRSLYIEGFENSIPIATSKDMIRRAKTLSLRGIPGSCKNIIPDLWQTIEGGMDELTQLALYDSDGIECVIGDAANPSQVGIISNLTRLTLSKVKHLKTLYSGQPLQGLFASLEELRIESCNSLEHILTEDVKEIVDGSEYQSYANAFPKLKILQIGSCKQLEYLLPISFAKSLAHLECLYVNRNDELRSVFGQSPYEELNLDEPQITEFSTLKFLDFRHLPNMISICPENYHPTWPSLVRMGLENCPRFSIKSINNWVAYSGLRQEDNQRSFEDLLKVVVALPETLDTLSVQHNNEVEVVFDVEQFPINRQQVNSSLHKLDLCDLSKLRHIWRGPKNSLLLQHLGLLQLSRCGNLKEVFPLSILKDLSQLKQLEIEDCNELEEIIEEDDQNLSTSPQLVFPRLVEIYIKHCHKLKCVLPKITACGMMPSLKVLYIGDASVLEQVFGDVQHDTTHTYEVVTPALEYILLWNLPSLTSVAPSIALLGRHIVVQRCPKLSLTSSITPGELFDRLHKGLSYEHHKLWVELRDIVESMDNSERETAQQIDCQQTGGQSNDRELTFITSPNLTESVEGGAEECTTSANVQIVQGVTSLAHSKPTSSTKSINQLMPNSEISAAMPTSSLLPKLISKQSTSNPVDISSPKTPSNETSVGDQECQSAQKEKISMKTDVKGSFEGFLSSDNAMIITPSTDSKLATSPHGILTTSTNTVQRVPSQIKFNPRNSDAEKDGKMIPVINLQELKDDDLISMLQSMEDDYGGKSPISSVPTVAAPEDELVAKALADLEDSLRMPLKDIATSEDNSFRLQTVLNFLSRLSLEDRALSHGVMAIINSMHKDLPNILSSFKQAFATVNKFAELEERDKSIKDELTQRKEGAIALVSKMSRTRKSVDEAQEKEARLKEQISRLEKERKDCEAELFSLQEHKRKYIAETEEFKKEIETVRKEKSEMEEDQRNAQQQLFQADHKWSLLGSQFEQNIANRNLS